MKLACVVLFFVAAASSELINIDDAIDKILVKVRQQIRRSGDTSFPIPAGKLPHDISFSSGYGYGKDSLSRTGDCTLLKEGNKSTFDLHFGYTFLLNTFANLKVKDDIASASFRIKDNSAQLKYLLDLSAGHCNVTLYVYRVERFRKVEFGSSRPEYDGMNVDKFFVNTVQPAINKFFDSVHSEIEKGLQATICKHHSHDPDDHVDALHLTVLNLNNIINNDI